MLPLDMAGLTRDTHEKWDELVVAAKEKLGVDLEPRSARRTCAQQAEQYEIGRIPNDTRQIVTRTKGCRSWHVTGRAVDFYVVRNGKRSTMSSDYTKVGELAEGLGWTWGGRFSDFGANGDEGHVEWHPGMTIESVCPNPDACVDVVPQAPSALPSFNVSTGLKVAGFIGSLALAAFLGVGLATMHVEEDKKPKRDR